MEIKSLFDPHKFSTIEIFSNNNGKTSSTKVVGFAASFVCLLLFIIFAVYYLINPGECSNILLFVDRTITYFSISAGLMGVKSITSAFGKNHIEIALPDDDKKNNYNKRPHDNMRPLYESSNNSSESDDTNNTDSEIEETKES